MAMTKRQKRALDRVIEKVYAETDANADHAVNITARLRLREYGGNADTARAALTKKLSDSAYREVTVTPGVVERHHFREVLRCTVRGSVHGTTSMAGLFKLVYRVGLGE